MKRVKVSLLNTELKLFNDKIIIEDEKEVVAVILIKHIDFKSRDDFILKLKQICKK